MRNICPAALVAVAAIIPACDRPPPAASAPPAGGAASAAPEPAPIDAVMVVSGRTLRVPVPSLKDEQALSEFFEDGSGIIESAVLERLLALVREGKGTVLSAPAVAIRSGDRASVLVAQSGGKAGTLNQSRQSLELGVTATALEDGSIKLAADARLVQLRNGVEVALADWGAPVGARAGGRAEHRVHPPQTIAIARQFDDEWYIWLAEPRLMPEQPTAPGP